MSSSQSNKDTSLPLVIVNPKSASGVTFEKWAATASDFRAHFGPFNVEFTKSAGDAANIAEQAAEAGRKFIIACGGDGTINEVANGILRSNMDAELGILPSGTGGDFRRSLKLPLAIREAAKALRDGETRRIDVGRVSYQNFSGETVSRYFVNVSSIGLAASIIKRVKSNKSLDWLPINAIRGMASFAVSTIQEVMDITTEQVRVRIDGGDENLLRTINFCVANARYFGGGMMIAPDARLNDGLLDIVNIGDLGTAKILINGYKLYAGTHQSLEEVKSTTAKTIEVSAADPSREILIETDGELPGRLPAVFEVIPNALNHPRPKIITPPRPEVPPPSRRQYRRRPVGQALIKDSAAPRMSRRDGGGIAGGTPAVRVAGGTFIFFTFRTAFPLRLVKN